MNTNTTAPTVKALEAELLALEERADQIADDVETARESIEAARVAFIDGTGDRARLLDAEREGAALEGVARTLEAQIEAKKREIATAQGHDRRAQKRAQILALAQEVEGHRARAFQSADKLAAALEFDLGTTAQRLTQTAQASRRLNSLLMGDDAPQFDAGELERLESLATEGFDSLRFQIIKQAPDAVKRDLLQLLNGVISSPTAAVGAARRPQADLSDLNAELKAQVAGRPQPAR